MKINEVIEHEELQSGDLKWLTNQRVKSLADFIKKNCSQILDVYRDKEKYLYRGMKMGHSYVLLASSQDNRKPKDTPENIQIKIDNRLKEAGFKALRSNSIFCSSNYYIAAAYSQEGFEGVFIIFPLNGFNFTYNINAGDLYSYYGLKNGNSRTEMFMHDLESDIPSSEHFCETYGFRNEDLGRAIINYKEVYINGKYIAIKTKWSKCSDLLDELNLPYYAETI